MYDIPPKHIEESIDGDDQESLAGSISYHGHWIPPDPTVISTSDATTIVLERLYEHLHTRLPNGWVPPDPTVVTTSDATDVLLDRLQNCNQVWKNSG